jgi:V8-like Glu-specific endopeptidase
MTDIEKLKSLPVEKLVKELKRREVKAEKGERAFPVLLADERWLRNVKSKAIAGVVLQVQRSIYGNDNREEIFNLADDRDKNNADGVVALFKSTNIMDNGNGTSTLATKNYRTEFKLCERERFGKQPFGAYGSGFLVAPRIIATAGHCVDSGNVTTTRFVFGFRMRDSTTAETRIANGEIYSGVSLIGRSMPPAGADWALVKLDRDVTNHQILKIRRSGIINAEQKLHIIGHPSGLPAKFADGAVVRDNSQSKIFIANLDAYHGNSGSPVFNRCTHEVEGILIEGGRNDFINTGDCCVSIVSAFTGGIEVCTRTTEFSSLLPEPIAIRNEISVQAA